MLRMLKLAVLFFLGSIGTAYGQAWQVVYRVGFVPTNPPGPMAPLQTKDDNVFNPTMVFGGGAQVPVANPAYLHFVDTVAAQDQKWDEYEANPEMNLDAAFPAGGTMVFRARRPAGAAGAGDIDIFDVRISAGDRFGIRMGVINGLYFEDGTSTAVNVGGLAEWTTYRITFAPENGKLRMRTYLNGQFSNDHLTNRETSENAWKMGSSSNGTGEYHLDWLLVSSDGVYPPGSGPALPEGFTEGPLGPTPTFTPLSTPTSACVADVDGDRVCDAEEGGRAPAAGKTNQYLPDSDGDGLDDGVEDANRNGAYDSGSETSARAMDTDSDALQDGVELRLLLTNPRNPGDPAVIPADADQDGLPASVDPADTDPDTDGDRFRDDLEATSLSLAAVPDNAIKPVLGNVDQAQGVDNADSQLILNFFGNQPVIPEFTPTRADANRDAFIDNGDSQQVLNFFGNRIPLLPAEVQN